MKQVSVGPNLEDQVSVHAGESIAESARMEVRSTPASSIALRGAGKEYGDTVAVYPTDLNVQAGEFMTLLGPSGSGKTTTLSMIAGFVDPSGGDIEIDGRSMSHVPAHKRGIGVVFQNYALFPHMDVARNVAFPLARRRVPRAERNRRVKSALATVKLSGYEDRFPSQLSGGQQQRVALARALVFEPGVLLMDEPLGALDRKLREWLQVEIKQVHREVGTTFIYVTHDQEEALALSDRIAVFHNGRIEQVATGSELYERPSTLFVGQFIGESTVVTGTVRRDGQWSWIDGPGGAVRVQGVVKDADRVAVLLRPESATILANAEASGEHHNTLPVTVTERSYLGSEWKFEVRLGDGSTGVVRQRKEDAIDVMPGDQASLCWRPEDGVLLEHN